MSWIRKREGKKKKLELFFGLWFKAHNCRLEERKREDPSNKQHPCDSSSLLFGVPASLDSRGLKSENLHKDPNTIKIFSFR